MAMFRQLSRASGRFRSHCRASGLQKGNAAKRPEYMGTSSFESKSLAYSPQSGGILFKCLSSRFAMPRSGLN